MTTSRDDPTTTVANPLALLERELIAAYAAGAGYDLDVLRTSTNDDARQVLRNASLYASDKLAEGEARSHYLHSLRGEV